MRRFSNVVNAVIVASIVLVGANFAVAGPTQKPIKNISFNQAGESETIDGHIWTHDNADGAFTDEYKFTLWGNGSFGFKLIEDWDVKNMFGKSQIDITSVKLNSGSSEFDATAESGNFVFNSGEYSGPSMVADWSWANLAQGDYTLTLSGTALNNPYGIVGADYQLRNITYTKGDGPVNPSEVPEPATMALLGFGLLGVAGVTRRNRK